MNPFISIDPLDPVISVDPLIVKLWKSGAFVLKPWRYIKDHLGTKLVV